MNPKIDVKHTAARRVTASKRCLCCVLLAALCVMWGGIAHADAEAQARRLHHFDVVKEHGIFADMGVVNGVPQLTLGAQRDDTDIESLGQFCIVIFDYYAELDPVYTTMNVVDGATGQLFATVDANGFHQG